MFHDHCYQEDDICVLNLFEIFIKVCDMVTATCCHFGLFVMLKCCNCTLYFNVSVLCYTCLGYSKEYAEIVK